MDDSSRIDLANKRLHAADRRPSWLLRGICVAMGIMGFVLISIPAYKFYQVSQIFGGNSIFGIPLPSSQYDAWSFYFEDLNEQDKLLLFGDVTRPDEVSQKMAFWRSEPDSPGAYIEYLSAYRSQNGVFPEDMLDVAEEIDAENALYVLYRAGELADESSEKIYPSGSSTSRGRRGSHRASAPAITPPPVIRKHVAITDVGKHQEALALLHRAASMKSCSKYGNEMMRRRLPLLDRDDKDWVTRMLPIMYLGSQSTHSFPLKSVTQVVQAEAYRCGQERDSVALKRLIDDWKQICEHVYSVSETLIDGMILRAVIHAPCEDLALAAKACDLPKVEKFYTALDKQLTDNRASRRTTASASTWGDKLYKEGSVYSHMSLPILEKQVNDSSIIPKPDTRADRLADHAFWNRVSSAGLWLLMIVAALITRLYQLRNNVLVRKLGGRLAEVYSWKDWSFVVIFGILLPVASYWLINELRTGASVQNWNVYYTTMLMPAGQSGSLLLLLLIAPMLAVSHRLNKTLPFRGKLGLRMLWGAAILSLLSMPIFGLVGFYDDNARDLLNAGFATQGLAVVVLAACPIVAMARHRGDGGVVLAKAARSNILAITYLAASLVMALEVHVYHSLEKHWVAEDKVFRLSKENTSLTTFETAVTDQLLKEMNAVIQQMNTEL